MAVISNGSLVARTPGAAGVECGLCLAAQGLGHLHIRAKLPLYLAQ